MDNDKLRNPLISIPFCLESNSGAYGEGLREADIVLVDQLLTLERRGLEEHAHRVRPPRTPSNISVSPLTVPDCLMSGSLRTLFLSGLRLRSYEAGGQVRKRYSDGV